MSATVSHHYTSTGLDSRKIAIWAFIGSECMLFISLISTYLIYKGRSRVGPFPHEVCTSDPYGPRPQADSQHSGHVGLDFRASHVVARDGARARGRAEQGTAEAHISASESSASPSSGSPTTATLGTTFLGFQAYEFTSFVHEGLTIRTNLFGSTFFTLTGFHGAHVTAGVIWLLTLLVIDFKRGLGPEDALNVDIMALYWHFVDVVWIAIFTLVYLIK